MDSQVLPLILLIIVFAASSAHGHFPHRTNQDSDCPEASNGCWCHDSFAQCWKTYEVANIARKKDVIRKLELLSLQLEDVLKYIAQLPNLEAIKLGPEGDDHLFECSCDNVLELSGSVVSVVNANDVHVTGCLEHGWSRDIYTMNAFATRCRRRLILESGGAEMRHRRSAKDDDVNKRASPRKGSSPAGKKVQIMEQDAGKGDAHNEKEVVKDQKPTKELFDFFMGHRRKRRSIDDVIGEMRAERQRRYAQGAGGMQGGYGYPQAGGAQYGGQPVQGYMNQGPPMGQRPAAAGPAGGFGAPQGQPPVGQPIGEAAGGGEFLGEPGVGGESEFAEYSSSIGEGETINAEVMEKIKAVLGATKIDLPVDINDPYDLGLLLRHLRHHSNLLANIGDPEVRNQVLTAMQEEEEEEEQDAANGVRDNVLNNLNEGPGAGAVAGAAMAAGMPPYPGGAQGGMRVGGQPQNPMGGNAYNPMTGYRQQG
uniref:Bindin n=1 Tax=Arbacia punctulata TaxID=7641 RepID=BIND_ARBPU|nr:RecName: Full=Bindin; Flags: Precursor [Arbacia punctulata]CAA38094.1 bindin [Arbacia punctulata]